MKCLKKLLTREAIDSITPSISESINTNKRSYLSEKGIGKLGWRSLRRLLAYRLSGQKRYLTDNVVASEFKSCLWLYYDVPQIGDALMDLAPRSLLHSLGIKIDLYTHKHLADLFAEDSLFNSVQTSPSMINPNNYDFVIVSSFKWRSIKHKIFYVSTLPWISIFEKFSGPEINRSLYSTQKIAEILGEKLNTEELEFHSCQKLSFNQSLNELKQIPNSVVIALGGADTTRKYEHWYSVVLGLKQMGIENVILVGNDSGLPYVDAIISLQEEKFKVHNYVAKTTLKECQQLMQRSSLIIAADGGLMHLAITSTKPVISLFNNAINPIWRLPNKLLALSVQSSTRDISDITSNQVIKIIAKAYPL